MSFLVGKFRWIFTNDVHFQMWTALTSVAELNVIMKPCKDYLKKGEVVFSRRKRPSDVAISSVKSGLFPYSIQFNLAYIFSAWTSRSIKEFWRGPPFVYMYTRAQKPIHEEVCNNFMFRETLGHNAHLSNLDPVILFFPRKIITLP